MYYLFSTFNSQLSCARVLSNFITSIAWICSRIAPVNSQDGQMGCVVYITDLIVLSCSNFLAIFCPSDSNRLGSRNMTLKISTFSNNAIHRCKWDVKEWRSLPFWRVKEIKKTITLKSQLTFKQREIRISCTILNPYIKQNSVLRHFYQIFHSPPTCKDKPATRRSSPNSIDSCAGVLPNKAPICLQNLECCYVIYKGRVNIVVLFHTRAVFEPRHFDGFWASNATVKHDWQANSLVNVSEFSCKRRRKFTLCNRTSIAQWSLSEDTHLLLYSPIITD